MPNYMFNQSYLQGNNKSWTCQPRLHKQVKGGIFKSAGYALVQCSPVVFHRWLWMHLNMFTDKVFLHLPLPIWMTFVWFIHYLSTILLSCWIYLLCFKFPRFTLYQTLISMFLLCSKLFFFCHFFFLRTVLLLSISVSLLTLVRKWNNYSSSSSLPRVSFIRLHKHYKSQKLLWTLVCWCKRDWKSQRPRLSLHRNKLQRVQSWSQICLVIC